MSASDKDAMMEISSEITDLANYAENFLMEATFASIKNSFYNYDWNEIYEITDYTTSYAYNVGGGAINLLAYNKEILAAIEDADLPGIVVYLNGLADKYDYGKYPALEY